MGALYDTIGIGYSDLRKPDPRIAAAIHRALGDAASVVNVGAGAGSYEPTDRHVVALEASAEMIRQRPPGSAPAHQGVAEKVPFADKSFDVAMAVLTVHHWTDVEAGLREMRRVAKGRIIILTFDPEAEYFWLKDYLPEIVALDQPIMPKIPTFARVLGATRVEIVPVPHDCTDGFLGAYWRRPHAYLDARVRGAISTFAKIPDASAGLRKLSDDLVSGAWLNRYGDLLALDELDVGYRLIVAE